MDILCSICSDVIGSSSVADDGSHKCTCCAQAELLPVALANGENIDVSAIVAKRPEQLADILREAIFVDPTILTLGFNEEIEIEKQTQVEDLGIDDLPPEDAVAVIVTAKGNGVTLETLSAEVIAPYKP